MITVANPTTTRSLPYVNGYGFKTSQISFQPSLSAVSLRKLKSIEKQKTAPSFEIEFSEFDFNFKLEIIEIQNDFSSNEITLFLKFNRNIIKAVLNGYWKENEGFYLQGLSLGIERQGETPTSGFLLKTLWAMFGLSSKFKIKIPDFKYEFTTSFDVPLDGASDGLSHRQIAYRLMVIEKTLRVKLPFPKGFINGEDIESIAFCYHAIVNREFEWFAILRNIPWTANRESLAWLPNTSEPESVTFRPEFVSKTIFGFDLPLGIMTGKIEKAVIDNYEEVKNNLSKLDGEIVNVEQRSVNGKIKMISLDVPSLPQNAWSKEIQKLVDLESKLDEMLLDKYFNLASSTLDGLTQEQKEAITERPKLEEEAFNF